jgi:hypothetical protein
MGNNLKNQGILKHDVFITSILPVVSLFAISLLVYGIFISKLGFYWDDWTVVWAYHALGKEGLAIYFKGNRPLSGLIYSIFFPYFGVSPIGWHVLALILRWLSSVVLFFVIRALWPERKSLAFCISVFALLYPGFGQQPIALTYIPQHFSFLLFLISLAGTILAIRLPNFYWFITFISLAAALCGYAIIEYFIGLEFIRPVIILLAIKSTQETRWSSIVKDVLKKWAPYLIIFVLFIVWRLFFFQAWPPSHDGISLLSEIMKNPISGVLTRFMGAVRNILMATVFAWARVLGTQLLNFDLKYVQYSWAVGILVAGIATLTLIIIRKPRHEHEDIASTGSESNPARTVTLVGLISLVFGGLPVIFAGFFIDYNLTTLGDRYTLPYMLGASLVLAGILFSFRLTRTQEIVFLSVILFLFASFQIRNGMEYRWDWEEQKSIFWQFAWRIPALEQGTIVFLYPLSFSLQGNHAVGPMNLLYNSNGSAGRMNYFPFDLKRPIISNWTDFQPGFIYAPSFKPDKPVSGGIRSFEFHGSTSKSLVVWNSPSGTLRFIDKKYYLEIPELPPSCRCIGHLSNMKEVVSTDKSLLDGPLLQIFGPEPIHGWSYFYQKAELERQVGYWDKVALLGDKVGGLGYKPKDLSEWFPFIEGYAMSHRYGHAIKLTEKVLDESPQMLLSLSSLWRRIIISKESDLQYNSNELDTLRNKLFLSEQDSISENDLIGKDVHKDVQFK